MLLNLILIFVSININAMNNSSNYPISIAHLTTNRDSNHLKITHFTDITAQRIGNILPAPHQATSFFVNESFVKSNPLLTQALVNLREEYATTAFAKSCDGFSLIENYWAGNFNPTSLLSSSTHEKINQLHRTLYQAAHFDGSPQSLANAMRLISSNFPAEPRLFPMANGWNKAIHKICDIIFDKNGCLKNTLSAQESQKLIQIHSEYLKSTTNCLAEWYDQLAILSYADSRYLDYLTQVLRNQNSILNKISSEGPLRGIDKLTNSAVNFCKSCANWFVGSRREHEKLHALHRNNTNAILKGVLQHYNSGEFQAALDYGNQADIFSQYPELHQAVLSKLNTGDDSNSNLSHSLTLKESAPTRVTQINARIISQSSQNEQLSINGLVESQTNHKSSSWPYSLQAPVIAALSKLEQIPIQKLKLNTTKKEELTHSINQRMSKEITTLNELTQQRLFVDNSYQQLAIHQKRSNALSVTQQNNVMFEKNYQASALSTMLAKECKADQRALEYCFGNHIQQQLHSEFIEIIDSSAQKYYANGATFSQKEVNKMIAEWAFMGLSRNQQGKVSQATSLANLCWSAGEFIQQKLDSLGTAIDNAGDYLINLIDKVESLDPVIRVQQSVIDAGRKLGLNIPKSFRPLKLVLKGYVGYMKGRLRGPIDLIAHPFDNAKATLKILQPIGKLIITHMDLCDTIDRAYTLDQATYETQINQLEQQISQQVDTLKTSIVDGLKDFCNSPIEDKAYLLGRMHGQYKFKNTIKSIGLKGLSRLLSSTNGAGNLEYLQKLALAMRGSKPVHTYRDQNIIYTVYDNGAVFAGGKHGTVKKIWCVSPPKNANSIKPMPQLAVNSDSLKKEFQFIRNAPNALAKVVNRAANTSSPKKLPKAAISELTHNAQSSSDAGLVKPEKIPNSKAKIKFVKETGELCRLVKPSNEIEAELNWAPKKWNEIRACKDDVQVISKNTGIPEHKINKIKNHLFHNEHLLARGYFQFDPDSEIASAWDRLYQGDFIKNDLMLLEHEYFELKFEKKFNTTYEVAHDAAINAGYKWNPPVWE